MVRGNQYSFSLSGEMETRKVIPEVGTYPPGTEHLEPSLLIVVYFSGLQN